jgi:hypothetical protein
MKSSDRMFRVLVLGGIALTACGGATATGGSPSDAAGGDTGNGTDGFPQEGPPFDASIDTVAYDTSMDTAPLPPDAFPTEGPAMIEASVVDAPAETSCFPRETAIMWDGCAPIGDGGVGDATTDGGPIDGATYDGFPQEGPPPPPPDT